MLLRIIFLQTFHGNEKYAHYCSQENKFPEITKRIHRFSLTCCYICWHCETAASTSHYQKAVKLSLKLIEI